MQHSGVPAVAANHVGYLDILMLRAGQRMVFRSKSEVPGRPVLGYLTDGDGIVFIRRDQKSDVARFDDACAQVIQSGAVLGIFSEGARSDGRRVLPFHSSLFAAAQWEVPPVWIGYEAEGDSVQNEVCYWGDMTFSPMSRSFSKAVN